jgi:D-serine deaminase-like pyridoxal phosphate-dependent protein
VIEIAGGADRWRPHVKTSKISAVWREMARAGLRHFKCATTREASELLASLAGEGVEDADVLLAYPLLGPALARLGQIADAYPRARVSILCEDPSIAKQVPGAVSIFVDVNPGMNRTGIPDSDVSAIAAVCSAAGARFRGVHYYDGHLHGTDRAERRRAAHAGYDRVLELLDELAREGFESEELVTSGTPTFPHAMDHPGLAALTATVHRISPGTVVYHDVRSEELQGDLGLVPAALVFTRVVSHPTAGVVTCDAGSKSLAAEAGDPCARVLGRADLVPQTPNEEHLPLRCSAEMPERGSELLLFPRHVCPTVNLADEALLVDGERFEVTAVTARGHETRVD